MSGQTKELNQKTKFIFEDLTAWKAILKFSIPAVIGMLIMGSYTFADKIIVANGVGPDANAGLLVSEQLLQTCMNLGFMISTGAGAYIAICLGKKDMEKIKQGVVTSVLAMLVLGIAAALFIGFSYESLMGALGAQAGQLKYARQYLDIVVWGIPFYMVGNLLLGFMRAEGKAKLAALFTIFTAIANIVIDMILIFGLGFEADGAAWATLFGGYILVAVLPAMYLLISKTTILKFNPFKIKNFKWPIIFTVCILGLPTFIRTISGTVQQLLVTGVMSNMELTYPVGVDPNWVDTTQVSGWQAVLAGAMPTSALLIMPIIGIIQGLFPLYSYNFGAKNFKRLRELFIGGLLIQVVYAAFVSFMFIFFGGFFLEMFGIPGEYNVYVKQLYVLIVSIVLIFLISFSYQAIGAPIKSMIIGITRNLFIFVPVFLLMTVDNDPEKAFNAYIVSDILTILVSLVLIRFVIKDLKRREAAENDKSHVEKVVKDKK